eukprot:TRINITY_DN18812_c0_g1_i1.p1 TRINITY_DN18812_c0_g1~~TRINITY_DN18812_c0_g1_i1.p1  ORF type:complete len:620 (+),score=30.74 TRINITY_DN18812_c0_g1_i1:155-1861(+)
MSAAWIRGSEITLSRSWGVQNVQTQAPFTTSTVVSIGGLTSTFTAASLGIAMHERKVYLKDLVRSFLPQFSMLDNYTSSHCAVRDLLTHRTGLPNHVLSDYIRSSKLSTKEWMQIVAGVTGDQPFRWEAQYSHYHYFILGEIIRIALNASSWAEVLQKRVLNPLNMTNTSLGIPIGHPKLATSYVLVDHSANDSLATENVTLDSIPNEIIKKFEQPAMYSTDGVWTTVDDLANFVRMWMDQKPYQLPITSNRGNLLRPLEILPGNPMQNELELDGYGGGLYIGSYRGHRVCMQSGGAIGSGGIIVFFPHLKIGGIIVANLFFQRNSMMAVLFAGLDQMLSEPMGGISQNICKTANGIYNALFSFHIPRMPWGPPKPNHPNGVPPSAGDYMGSYHNDIYPSLVITPSKMTQGHVHTGSPIRLEVVFGTAEGQMESIGKIPDLFGFRNLSVPVLPSYYFYMLVQFGRNSSGVVDRLTLLPAEDFFTPTVFSKVGVVPDPSPCAACKHADETIPVQGYCDFLLQEYKCLVDNNCVISAAECAQFQHCQPATPCWYPQLARKLAEIPKYPGH